MAQVDEDAFVALSAELTGYDEVELRGTGVAPGYVDWLVERFPEVFPQLIDAWDRVVDAYPPDEREQGVRAVVLADPLLGPFARGLLLLWYTAIWYPPDGDWSAVYAGRPQDTEPVALGFAYTEGLVWRAIGAHPMTAKPTGFGTWSLPPAGV